MSDKAAQPDGKPVSRRQFLKVASAFAIGLGLGDALPRILYLDNGMVAIPASKGYLLVDTKKCAGCVSCMLACSLAHEGRASLSLSRIQIVQNPFGHFPIDISQDQCRQCVNPSCVAACPTGALHVDAANGNVRVVDQNKCIGCERCVEACSFKPSRAIWNFEAKHSQKCDLCTNATYWKQREGHRACEEVCPMKAIKYTETIPDQTKDAGYQTNLRGASWKHIGFPVD